MTTHFTMFPSYEDDSKISKISNMYNDVFNNDYDYEPALSVCSSSDDTTIPNEVLDKATSVWLEEYWTLDDYDYENVIVCDAPEPMPLFIKRQILTAIPTSQNTSVPIELIPRFSEGYLKRLEREAEARKIQFAANRKATTIRPKKGKSAAVTVAPVLPKALRPKPVITNALKIAKSEADIRRDEAIALQAKKIAERIKSQTTVAESVAESVADSVADSVAEPVEDVDEEDDAVRIAFIKKVAACSISYSNSDKAKAAAEAREAAKVKAAAAAAEAKAIADAKAAAEAEAKAKAKAAAEAKAKMEVWYLVKAPVKPTKPAMAPPAKPLVKPTPQSLIKTMMCSSVIKNVQCRHGKTCRFAHTIDECNPVECKWGAKCKNGNCGYFHSAMESKLDWVKRTCRC